MDYRKAVIAVSLVFVLLLSGCDPVHFSYSKDGSGFELHQVVIYNVAGGEVSVSLVEEVETDGYGRILFTYCVNYEEYPIGAYVICQKRDDDFVYYYEDQCVVMAPTLEEISVQALEDLKKQNDWNQEFQEEKCVRKEKLIQSEGIRSRKTVERFELDDRLDWAYAVTDHFEEILGDDSLVIAEYAGMDLEGRVLYYADCGTAEEPVYYAVIVQPDGSIPEGAYIRIQDFYNCSEEIIDLKTRNGWRS